LKNVGAQFAFPTSDALSGPTNNTKAAIVILAKRTNQSKQSALTGLNNDGTGNFIAVTALDEAWPVGSVIGEVVITNYIRFHARVTNSIISMAVKERAMGHKMMLQAKKVKAAKEG